MPVVEILGLCDVFLTLISTTLEKLFFFYIEQDDEKDNKKEDDQKTIFSKARQMIKNQQ